MGNYSDDYYTLWGPTLAASEIQQIHAALAADELGDWKLKTQATVAGQQYYVFSRHTEGGPNYGQTVNELFNSSPKYPRHYEAFGFIEESPSFGIITKDPNGKIRVALPTSEELKVTTNQNKHYFENECFAPYMPAPAQEQAVRALFGLEYDPMLSPYFGEYEEHPENTPQRTLLAALLTNNQQLARKAIAQLHQQPCIVELAQSCLGKSFAERAPISNNHVIEPTLLPAGSAVRYLEFLRSLKIPSNAIHAYLEQNLGPIIGTNTEQMQQCITLTEARAIALGNPTEMRPFYELLLACISAAYAENPTEGREHTNDIFTRASQAQRLGHKPILARAVKDIAASKIEGIAKTRQPIRP